VRLCLYIYVRLQVESIEESFHVFDDKRTAYMAKDVPTLFLYCLAKVL
jgi:hypothetical protein